jgi:small subunit ribosomal protein S14
MARQALIAKAKKTSKFSTRVVRRCWRCGRNRGYMRDFGLCRICFRELASSGDLPGITKSSW